jgi:hypothetical protein
VNVMLYTVANGVLLLNVTMTFVGARRPLYDRLAAPSRKSSRRPDIEAADQQLRVQSGTHVRVGGWSAGQLRHLLAPGRTCEF